MSKSINLFVRVHGGLGNQFFQYAYSLYLKEKYPGTNVYFDNFHFLGDIERPLSISKFNLSTFVLRKSRFNKFVNFKFNKVYNLIFNYKYYVIEGLTEISYDSLPMVFPEKDMYFDGYWQKLFIVNQVEGLLKNDLVLKQVFSMRVRFIEEKIKSCSHSVSIHVRRTDFINSKKNQSIFAQCSVDYYCRAIDFISNIVDQDIVIFIFSDDFDWVKENMKLEFKYFLVEKNYDFEDLYLMTLCKHNITANSTFSWWGAWLNPYKNKIVITPEKWFENDISSEQLIPLEWIKLPN
jgi:hypothetical protein